MGWNSSWPALDDYLLQAGLAAATIPIAADREWAREEAARLERVVRFQEEARQSEKAFEPMPAPEPDRDPPWGTPAAKKLAIERLRRQIAKNNKLGAVPPLLRRVQPRKGLERYTFGWPPCPGDV